VSRLPLLAVVPFLLPVLTACGADVLAAEDVATTAEDALKEERGTRPDISCPEGLPAEVGAAIRCVLTAGNDPATYGVRITVTSVDADDVRFEVAVDEQPQA
jgi:Domain of unknown function (DUF4333)